MGRGLDGFFSSAGMQPARGAQASLPAVFKARRRLSRISGGYGVGETPLPIPNRAVKPHSADGTWLARARESRSPPVYRHESAALGRRFVVLPRLSAARGTRGSRRRGRRHAARTAAPAAPCRGARGTGRSGPAAPRHRAGASLPWNAAARGAGAGARHPACAVRRAQGPPGG